MKRWRGVSRRVVAAVLVVVVLSGFVAFVLPRQLFPEQPVLTAKDWQSLFPYRSRFVDLDNGSRIHYVDEGQGPTLLLLHGNPTSSFLYRHLIAELKGDFRVVAADYPGFGKSSAPTGYRFTAAEQARTMLDFFDQLNLDQAVLMVQDWGGPIGFHLAQQRPERIRGFVIGNTWAWPLSDHLRYRLFSWFMGGPLGRRMTEAHIGVVHLFLKRGLVHPLGEKAYAAYFQAFLKGDRAPVTTFPRELISAGSFLQSIERGMEDLSRHQALIVWGEKDFAFGAPFRERFEQIFPDHHTVLLPNAGHFIQEDAPQEIARAIRASFGLGSSHVQTDL